MTCLRFLGPVVQPDQQVVARAVATAKSVADLLTQLGYSAEHRRFLQVFFDGRRLRPTDAIPRDGEIVITLPMGGG